MTNLLLTEEELEKLNSIIFVYFSDFREDDLDPVEKQLITKVEYMYNSLQKVKKDKEVKNV